MLHYFADNTKALHSGTHLVKFTLENVRFTDLKAPSKPEASAEEPLTVVLKNVNAEFTDDASVKQLFLLGENSHTVIVEE